jgi:hypothetical protein
MFAGDAAKHGLTGIQWQSHQTAEHGRVEEAAVGGGHEFCWPKKTKELKRRGV